MHIRYYRTGLEGRDEDRFKMLAVLLDAAAKEFPGLKPRLLHLADRRSEGGYSYLSAIIVWE